jgi:uncharacterized membrane-anchored protein YjiN (DUF445 family)
VTAAAPSSLGPKPTDDARRADIARVRRKATGLLLFAAVVFIVARWFEHRWPWLGYVRATAEASLVGGLADWFAVTALFRQPLGLPIPHTAIVKRQKDRIARVLGTFVQNHFLTREVISERLRTLGIAERIGRWLSDPANSRRVAGQLTEGVAATVDTLPAQGGWQSGLVDQGVKLVARAVTSSDEAIASTLREQIKAGMPRWMPGMVHEAVHKRVMAGLDRFVHELVDNPEHPARARLESSLRDALQRFRDSAGGTGEQGAGEPNAIARVLESVGTHLVNDAAARQDLEQRITETAADLVEEHGAEVAALIEHTVAGWDPDLAADRIELAVGRDLQYIRLNGTLVGGLAGLAIYWVSRFF